MWILWINLIFNIIIHLIVHIFLTSWILKSSLVGFIVSPVENLFLGLTPENFWNLTFSPVRPAVPTGVLRQGVFIPENLIEVLPDLGYKKGEHKIIFSMNYHIIWRIKVLRNLFKISLFNINNLTLFRIGLFRAAYRLRGPKNVPLPKIRHTYPKWWNLAQLYHT